MLGQSGFSALFEAIGRESVGFDDFRRNGLLLPANDTAALRLRMPMHRGPHRSYNLMVAERVGQVEGEWARLRLRAPEVALTQAVMRLDLLQRALRRRLISPDRPYLRLNRHDPLGAGLDFSSLDALADALWGETELALPA
ncbi:MAG: AHH domain-containing protein [Croceibacterium sp.]